MAEYQTYGSIIVSHQARLRCLMHKFGIGIISKNKPSSVSGEESMLSQPLLQDRDRHSGSGVVVGGGAAGAGQVASFMNGAVIRMAITKDGISVRLIVTGIIDPSEDKAGYTYFVGGEEEEPSSLTSSSYTKIPFPNTELDTKMYSDLVDNNTYVFYLVRHGQAVHNTLTTYQKMMSPKDTSLTDKGKEQAIHTGKKLSDIILHNEVAFDNTSLFLFGSDLKRTRQTMEHLRGQFPEGIRSDMKIIYILPCAHELRYKPSEDGNCDGSMLPTPNENISECTRDDCKFDGYGSLRNDWSDYYKFYSGATRSTRSWLPTCLTCAKKPVGKRCRDTDMISQAIDRINTLAAQTIHTSRSGGLVEMSDVSSFTTPQSSPRSSFSSVSSTFDDDESDGDDDPDFDDDLRKTIVVNPVNRARKGGGRRTRVRRVSKTRRGRSLKKTRKNKNKNKNKKTRRAKKNKKTRRKRRKQ